MSQSVAASEPLASKVAAWVAGLTFEQLPADVVATTKLRVLDVIGLSLAGSATALGHSVRAGVHAMAPQGPSRVWGSGDRTAAPFAAFANASFAQALEFDDTHNESIVHMSSPSVASALALAETRRISGRELIVAVAVGNEIACRIGSVAPGTFHRRGFHPTGLFSPFGIAYAAGKLLGLDVGALAWAAGIAGSTAAGLLECWVDGTQSKFLHSGFAAQNGMAAALLAQAGASGPPRIFEGRFGLFASHLQDAAVVKNFARITDGLGTRWDSRNSSFKPFPAAHVLHPYIDLLLRLRAEHAITPADVVSIECPVAEFNVSIVCEPVAEKTAPATEAHCRVCLQYTLAEALVRGELGRTAYTDANRTDPEILALAKRVTYRVDPDFPPPGRFKGALTMRLADGRVFDVVEEYNRGSAENPMTMEELRAKFDDNAGGALDASARDLIAQGIASLETLDDAGALVRLACRV